MLTGCDVSCQYVYPSQGKRDIMEKIHKTLDARFIMFLKETECFKALKTIKKNKINTTDDNILAFVKHVCNTIWCM